MIKVKRVYDEASPEEGHRFFVERLWPRGITKERLASKAWLKEVAPSADLRTWYGHDPAKWEEFQPRYIAELEEHPDAWRPLLDAARAGTITLVYSARDPERNSAVVLKAFLEARVES
jgi:uncharacterized protein YeaO (DUF488 family)